MGAQTPEQSPRFGSPQGGADPYQTHPLAAMGLARALIPQNKLAEARDILGRLLSTGRMMSAVHRLLGDAHAQEGKYSDAAQSYRTALLASARGMDAVANVEASLTSGAEGPELIAPYVRELERLSNSQGFGQGRFGARARGFQAGSPNSTQQAPGGPFQQRWQRVMAERGGANGRVGSIRRGRM